MQMTAEEIKSLIESRLKMVQRNIETPYNKIYLREYKAQECLLKDLLNVIR